MTARIRVLLPLVALLTAAAAPSAPAPDGATGPPLQVVKQFGDDFRLVGIGVSHGGRVFATAPANPVRSVDSVVEVNPSTGAVTPYPDAAWNRFRDDPGADPEWVSVQALSVDADDHLWALDSSLPKIDQHRLPPKLVEFDLATNAPLHLYTFENTVTPADSLNDVRVDPRRHTAYLTNSAGRGGLIVLDLATGRSRLVLAGTPSAVADPRQHLLLAGRPALRPDGSSVRIEDDGIALSPDGVWLYYRPLTDHTYWRIRTADLRDAALSPAALAQRVRFLGTGALSGGLIMDRAGTLYAGDLEHHAVVAFTLRDGRLVQHPFLRDPRRLAWADGFAIAPDLPDGSFLYISDSHLNEIAFRNDLPRSGPFTIFRARLPDRGR